MDWSAHLLTYRFIQACILTFIPMICLGMNSICFGHVSDMSWVGFGNDLNMFGMLLACVGMFALVWQRNEKMLRGVLTNEDQCSNELASEQG